MQNEISGILERAKKMIVTADDLNVLEKLRVQYLGKKGELTEFMKSLGQISPEDRPILGKAVNLAKNELENLLGDCERTLKARVLEQKLNNDKIDITLPGRGQGVGSLHPVTRVRQRVVKIFSHFGFSVVEGPEIENDYYNFSALNFPDHHPARDTQDSFYFDDGLLLRTHTSNGQIRVMENTKPPLRIVAPGRVYRRDSDPTHTPMFNQVEVLMVDRDVTFANLKALLEDFFVAFFERKVKLRFRPSFFPFTEPSAEVDIMHFACDGKGCRVCGNSGWLEVLGSGMVHPNVLRNVNIDPDEFTGFAFGMGLDRLAMLRYQIDDLRLMFENDWRFLKQF
jgi:phenylalanyl-tRNA synthetase alpha chain